MSSKSISWMWSGLMVAASLAVVAEARADATTIQTQFASYGYAEHRANVKDAIVKMCDGKASCSFKVTNETLATADPSPGDEKGLIMAWKCGDAVQKTQFPEGKNAKLECK